VTIPLAEVAIATGDPAWDEALGLLQAGFYLRARTGLSAREFMREALRLDDEYIEKVVSTVFIDAKPVDDIDSAIVAEGSLIALSAAMPGLVGAVMRRKSPYASFREAISYAPPSARSSSPPPEGGAEGLVRVKLFNSVMRDHGRKILARGILVAESAAEGLLAGRARVRVRMDSDEAASSGEGVGLVFLRVEKVGEAVS
jgi:hypothetical protein